MMSYTLIRNGSLIDGGGTKPVENGAVLIRDGRIVAAGREAKLTLPKEEITELDAQGGTILPGFIDAHVHLTMENFNLEKMLTTPFSYNFYKIPEYARRTLEGGITSVRDAGGFDLGMKKAADEGLFPSPRVMISVAGLSITGGHGDSWMPSGADLSAFGEYPGMPDTRCDGPADVRKMVRIILRSGAEVIKICSTGGVFSPTDRPEYTQFSPEELAVIVQEGQFRGGIKVMSHAEGTEGIKQAVKAGIHSIEHGIFLDDECIELMVAKGTFLVPTLYAPLSIVEKAQGDHTFPDYVVKKASEVYETHKVSISKAYKAGVKIAMGTDAGVMPHGTNLREMSLMCEAGLSPMEAIVATTKTAAECMGWEDQIGTLEPGKLADVVVAKINPLEDIRGMADNANIALVLKGGVVVKDRRN